MTNSRSSLPLLVGLLAIVLILVGMALAYGHNKAATTPVSPSNPIPTTPDTLPPTASPTPFQNDRLKLNLTPGDAIENPAHVTGSARRMYFEAVFQVKVLDADKQVIGSGIATAQGDWMVDAFVPFVADISYTTPTTASGFLRFEADNPSALPQYDYHVDVPVIFASK